MSCLTLGIPRRYLFGWLLLSTCVYISNHNYLRLLLLHQLTEDLLELLEGKGVDIAGDVVLPRDLSRVTMDTLFVSIREVRVGSQCKICISTLYVFRSIQEFLTHVHMYTVFLQIPSIPYMV